MNLEEAIIAYGTANLTSRNEWFAWRPINSERLPCGIVLPAGNQYAQNVALKQLLSVLYATGNDDTRCTLTHYYISIWGGVRGNKEEKLRTYALASPATLIANGRMGIASWSKALCIRSPADYAIYDARVALALNCLQEAYKVDNPQLFPLLQGQNKTVNKGAKCMAQYAHAQGWAIIPDHYFYTLYNTMLARAASVLDVEIYTLEMLFFSRVLDLISIAFPEPDGILAI